MNFIDAPSVEITSPSIRHHDIWLVEISCGRRASAIISVAISLNRLDRSPVKLNYHRHGYNVLSLLLLLLGSNNKESIRLHDTIYNVSITRPRLSNDRGPFRGCPQWNGDYHPFKADASTVNRFCRRVEPVPEGGLRPRGTRVDKEDGICALLHGVRQACCADL